MATVVLPKFIRQDWGDREIAGHFLSQGIPPPSPSYEGPTDPSSFFGIFINKEEKVIRIVDATTGEPLLLPEGYTLEIEYEHSDPTFKVVQNDASISKWGLRESIIVSPDKQMDTLFTKLAEAEIRDNSQPTLNIECEVYDDIYQVGDTVHFVLPELGVDMDLTVYEIVRDFDANVRRHYPQRDYGQSVKIKAGAKIPKSLRHVLSFLKDKLNAIERRWNLSDLDSESGISVPKQWVRYYPEDVAIRETVTITKFQREGRINEGRIGVSRIANQ